jgi:hypothetical protein
MRAFVVATLVIATSLATVLPAAADGGYYGKRRGQQERMGQRDIGNLGTGGSNGAVNIVQNGNENGVAVVAGGGTTNIAQNGNNNNLTVIQVTVQGRGGKHGRRGRF